jgi:glycerophosphoryl diester phosphodiesterase
MRIIEKNIVSHKGNIEDCEDAIIVTDNFACVIDGATSKSDRLWNGNTSGFIASRIISEAIKSLPQEVSCCEAINNLTSSIANYYRKINIFKELHDNPIHRFSAALALYSLYYSEIWMVGDCQCMTDNELHENTLLVDNVMSNARALYLHMELLKGKATSKLLEHDTGKDFIKPLLEKQWMFQNSTIDSPYTYGVIDGFEVPKNAVKIVEVKEGTKYIVLSSDGYPILKPSLDESERILKKIISEDPLCINLFKSTKGVMKGQVSFDDRAYVKIEL